MKYRQLSEDEISKELFLNFHRYQKVTDCYRKIDGVWQIKSDPFIDDWGDKEYEFLVQCLEQTIREDGVVFGAFHEEQLKGFASVSGSLIGSNKQYSDLTSIHVSNEMRGHGIGKELFRRAADWARQLGAKKLYISSHSAVESQAFYRSLGCVEAAEYQQEHVESEPCDCQLEYAL